MECLRLEKILDKVQRIEFLSITGVRKSCPQATLNTMFCLTPFDLYVKQCTACSAIRQRESELQCSTGHSAVLRGCTDFRKKPPTRFEDRAQ